MVERQLVARIDGLDAVGLTAEVYRHVDASRHPLSGTGARIAGGRWNPPDSFTTLYLGLERQTVVHEFYRWTARQRRAPEDFLPRRFYRYDLSLSSLLDLRHARNRSTLDLTDELLRSDDAQFCQAVGEAAHYLGREGVIAPSAAGPGTVVAVFFDRLKADSYLRDLDYEPWSAPPAQDQAC